MTDFHVIIPARKQSTRLPNKMLLPIANKPLVQHVVERCLESAATSVVVATDHQSIRDALVGQGIQVLMTSDKHQSGTDRLAEAAEQLGLDADAVIINVQGDEPEIPYQVIDQLAQVIAQSNAPVATLITPIGSQDQVVDPNVVKVVCDEQGKALYFSRAPVPWDRDQSVTDERLSAEPYYRHIGIYAYRVKALRAFAGWDMTKLERLEKLEQLRFLEKGFDIQTAIATELPPVGIDTEQDYLIAKQRMES